MSNKNQIQDSQKTGDLKVQIIGIRKYEMLKSLKPENLSAEQKSQIEVYESKQRAATPEQIDLQHKYFEEIMKPKKVIEFKMTAKGLYYYFKQNFGVVTGKQFVKVPDVTIKNLEPLIYYFTKDERFFECENLSQISEPSFDKGLLIIGNYGNGKTSAMKVLEHVLRQFPGMSFKGYSANEVVTMFERCTGDNAEILRKEFEKAMYNGDRYFDDLKTERIASNYGKVNIFKEILEERYTRMVPDRKLYPDAPTKKTHITCNFKEGEENDLEAAVEEFGEKYGGRVWDRMHEMFNIIEFKGKSFRK